MAYTAGDLILDTHYNDFATQINTVWGAGAGSNGYGQSNTISPVSDGQLISATQWATLLARISTAASHQGTTLTAITPPVAGDVISAYTALAGNLSAISTNRLNAAGTGTDITTGGVGQRTTAWVTAISMAYTITFNSADEARYFFNAGGTIRIAFSRSGGQAHAKNSEWTNLCSQCGTIVFSNGAGTATIAGTAYTGTNKVGGSGTVYNLQSTFGALDLATTDTEIFRQYEDSGPYTATYLRVLARSNATGLGNTVTITVIYQDDAADNSIPASIDYVDGTLQTTMVIRPPSTSFLTNTWGTPTMSCSVSGG